jgi:hypothetical protein
MIRKILCFKSILVALLGAALLVYPVVRAWLDVRDPVLKQAGIPAKAWRLGRNLSPRYAAWAQQRVAQGKAETLFLTDISGTEWPLFGSVFYLWGLENLQGAWDAGDHSAGVEPKVFAREGIIAASDLVMDPRHAAWVKKHWGDNYLKEENVFYRMLLMAAAASRENLLHDGAYTNVLRDQVESLAQELDDSHSGLLNDYPGQCFPGDVAQAVACIRRADAVLGTDHSRMIARAVRGFIADRLTPQMLPPYMADASTGKPRTMSRGCANAYLCLSAPEIWPYQAKQWFEAFDTQYWQERITATGYREFPPVFAKGDWTADIDAGPVIAGHGVSASAFGMGAARRNGRFDRSFPLAAEMVATAWELPTGTLAIPRLLSNFSDAPYVGEAAIFWLLTVQPEKGFAITPAGAKLPTYVSIVLITGLILGLGAMAEGLWRLRVHLREPEPPVLAPPVQLCLWAAALVGLLITSVRGPGWLAFVLLLTVLILPLRRKLKTNEEIVEKPNEAEPPISAG